MPRAVIFAHVLGSAISPAPTRRPRRRRWNRPLLDAQALSVCQSNQLLGLFHVLLDGVVAAIEHDGREAGLDAGLAALIGAVIQMQGNGNGDAHGIDHCADHGSDGLETGHVLAGTLGNTQNHRALHFLAGGQNGLGPLQIVDVELSTP